MPIALETSYVPQKYCPGLEQYDFTKVSLYATLMNDYKLSLSRHDEKISIAHLTKQEASYLHARENDAAYCIKGVTYDTSRSIEYCITLNPADRYILTSRLQVNNI